MLFKYYLSSMAAQLPSPFIIIQIAVIMCYSIECLSETAVVSVTLPPVAVVEGEPATLECGFFTRESSLFDSFHGLTWSHNGEIIVTFDRHSLTPTYYEDTSLSKFQVVRNHSSGTLRILQTLYSDSGTFKCEVEYSSITKQIRINSTEAELTVFVPTTNISLFDSTGSSTTDDDVAYLIEDETRQFTCMVPGINPEASFRWTLKHKVLTQERVTHEVDEVGLTTSTSRLTLLPTLADHGQILLCFASNIKDRPGKSANITLTVKAESPGDIVRYAPDVTWKTCFIIVTVFLSAVFLLFCHQVLVNRRLQIHVKELGNRLSDQRIDYNPGTQCESKMPIPV